MERTYEMNADYILEVLENEEDRLIEKILQNRNVPETIKFDFKKLLAVKNEIEKINIDTVLQQGCIPKTINHKILINQIINTIVLKPRKK